MQRQRHAGRRTFALRSARRVPVFERKGHSGGHLGRLLGQLSLSGRIPSQGERLRLYACGGGCARDGRLRTVDRTGLHAARPRARNRLRTLLLCSCRRPYLPQRNDFVHHARKGRGARTDTRREDRLRHADRLGAHRHLGHGRRHLHLRRRSDGHRRGFPAEKGGAERRDQAVVRYGSDLAALHLHRSERKHLLRGRGLRRHAVEDLAQHGRRVHHRGRRRHAARQQYPPQRLGGTAERSVERRLPLRRP